MINKYINALIAIFLTCIAYSCANMASPNGGPYDETPPRFIGSRPLPNETNIKPKRIELVFDEIVQIDNPLENVIITPPQLMMPVIRSINNRITIELNDSLIDNTTYTIDFTNSISDNNEKNAIDNFTFAFSTGDVIDSLEISGILLNASNLEPMPGITIGLHSNLEDSAFTSETFLRTSRTNDRGRFTIRNIAEGTYRIYALNDVNRDFKFDQPAEDIAFLDSIIIPAFEFTTQQDTIWRDSLTVDTILVRPYTRFTPDDIELFLFKEDFSRQYLLRAERPSENRGILRFNAPLDTIPALTPVNFTPTDSSWYFTQLAEENTAVNYWFTDLSFLDQDTIKFEVTYPRSDSLNILRAHTDTLDFVMRRRQARRSRDNDEEETRLPLGMSIKASGTMEVYDTIRIEFNEPVLDFTAEHILLEQAVDTLWHEVDFHLYQDPDNSLAFFIERKWQYGEEFRISIDSATVFSLYERWNNAFESEFKIKQESEYGHLYIETLNVDTTAFVELLTAGDLPVRKATVNDGGALFMNLRPGKYYARIIIDTNGNNEWDTGNYADKRQPEAVYYCPTAFDIMSNFQIEHTWDVTGTPVTRQKPLEITKNKPRESTRPIRDYRNEGRSSSSSSSNIRRSF
jgi:hypothetical protein